jgi:hypothetical protein
MKRGIISVLTQGCSHVGAGLSLLVTALHDLADIDQAAGVIGASVNFNGTLATQEDST